jgi:hypothetical protein
MSNRIFTRSPYWASINGSANDVCRVDLYIWNGDSSTSAPVTVTRSLVKRIPSSLITYCTFNIAPFLREYIDFVNEPELYNSLANVYLKQYCNVVVKKYLNDVLESSTQFMCLDGYGEYLDGYNETLQTCLLKEGTYYYYYDSSGLVSDLDKRPGHLTVDAQDPWSIKYTDLVNGATTTVNYTSTNLISCPRVYSTYWNHGNKLEILDGSSVVQATYYFYPLEESKYPVQYLDFINRYGAWQKEFLFKASRSSIALGKVNEYSHIQSSFNYDTSVGQRKVSNVNGTESIKCNTGWVDESFSDTIKQLLMSERVLLNGKPVILKTKNFETQKHLTDKLINYTIEFDYAYDIINTSM